MNSFSPIDWFCEHALKWCVILFGTSLLLFMIAEMKGCVPDYSEGERTGLVTKISKKGFIWKTWECHMNLGGVVPGGKDGAMIPNVWFFTVENEEVLAALQVAQTSQKPVTIRYSEWLFKPVPRTETGYMALEVR